MALTALSSLPLSLGGCTGSGRQSSVRFDIAPACGDGSPLQLGCVEVRVCESDRLTQCASVAPAGGPYPAEGESGASSLLVPVSGGALRFDVRATPGVAYDVEVVAYALNDRGASPVAATGYATRVMLDGGSNTVRLHPANTWSCLDAPADLLLRRAFHQSVPLSNGDALIIGGVTFERSTGGLSLVAGTPTASLVGGADSVLVYDAHDERLYPVNVSEGDVADLRRAMFQARWIERTTPDALERVRLYGGVTGTSSLTFSVSGTTQFPVRVSPDATPAPTVDLLYDARDRSLTIQRRVSSVETVLESERTALPGSRVESFAALVGGVSSMPEDVRALGTAAEAVTELATLPQPRRGATLTRMGARGFIVYGGNATQTAPAQENERALWLSASGAVQALTLPTSLSVSALQTASSLDDDTLLFVGGVGLSGAAVQPPTGAVVRAYELAASGGRLEEILLTGGGEEQLERIYHSATLYRAPRAARHSVLIAGGATRVATAHFQPLDSVYVVDIDATEQVHALPPLDTARFGHSAALLRGGRVLVTGGLRRGIRPTGCTVACEESSSLYLVDTAEMLVVRPLPAAVSCDVGSIDAGSSFDGGRDAGRSDAAAHDAATHDAGVDEPDGDG